MQPAIAFLLDADNLNDPAAVSEAIERLHTLVGPSTIRRAYGSNDSLKGLAAVLKQYTIRPCANFVLEKNTTDMALAVDAMEIACTAQPSVMAIGSGDMDFLPLVARLRERGVRVIGFSLNGKMSTEAMPAYPELFFVGQAPREGAVRGATRAVAKFAKAAASAAGFAPAAAPVAAPPPAPSRKAAPARKAPARKAPAAPAAPAATPATSAPRAASTRALPRLRDVLDAVPALRDGKAVQLNEATQLLRAAGLLGRNAGSPRFFDRFPGDFELTPAKQPNRVRWVDAPG